MGDLTREIDRVRIIHIMWTSRQLLCQPDWLDDFAPFVTPAAPFARLLWRRSNSSRAIWRPIRRARRKIASSNRALTAGPAVCFGAGAGSSVRVLSSLAVMLPRL